MKKKNELGLLIKRQRDVFRLTQRELAGKLGVKASHVAYIEGGLRRLADRNGGVVATAKSPSGL